MGRFIDLAGRRFGRLIVIERAQLVRGRKPVKPHWLVRCDCGTTKIVGGSDLKLNKVVSCGCFMRQMVSIRTKQPDPESITIKSIITHYRTTAIAKDLPFELSYESCVELFRGDYFYCGQSPSKIANVYLQRKRSSLVTDEVFASYNFVCNGIDRVDNNLGYLNKKGQCVSCCSFCNNAKLDLTIEEWGGQITRWANLTEHQSYRRQQTELSTLNPFQIDTIREIIRSYKRAKKQDLQVELSEETFHFLFQQPCYYCGTKSYNLSNKYITKDGLLIENKGCPLKKTTEFDRALGYYAYNGIDRKNNLIGYVESNCVPCCMVCNHAKEDLPYQQFVENLARLTSHQRIQSEKNPAKAASK